MVGCEARVLNPERAQSHRVYKLHLPLAKNEIAIDNAGLIYGRQKKFNIDHKPNNLEAAIPPWGVCHVRQRRGLGGCQFPIIYFD